MSPRWAVVPAALAVAACGGSATPSTSTQSATTPPPQAHAEIPAVYTVTATGSLQPPTVSVPAAIPVQLTVISRDARPHTAALEGHTLRVPAGGRASVLISGLKNGTYVLALDGTNRGALVVGAQPGP